MAVLTIRPNGLSLIDPPAIDRPVTFGRRGAITGWSRQAARRHTRWVQSVDEDELDGFGYALTLTTRLMAAGPQELYDILHKWWNRQKVRGGVRCHWVRENHADGRPHFHLAVYFDHKLSRREMAEVVRDWVECASPLRPAAVGQDCKALRGHRGWGQYCAKHSARSVSSYQRTGMPKGWSRCGRLWGKFGEWPTREDKYVIDAPTAHVLRGMLADWRRGDANGALARARLAASYARSEKGKRQAAHHVVCAQSRVVAVEQMERNAQVMRRGVAEWTEREESLQLLRAAADQVDGFVVLVGESVDADGVVTPWQLLRSGPEGPGMGATADDWHTWTALPDPDALDREDLLDLHRPTEASAEQLAAGAIFALERKAGREKVERGRTATVGRCQKRQHRAVAQPGVTVGRRDGSRALLGLSEQR